MSFVLRVGSIDVSPYVRVGQGEGLDPFGDFLQPQFLDSPLADGQKLLNVTAVNREFAVPVHFHDLSKDAVHAFIASLRQEMDAGEVVVEWRDSGASLSSFFDLEYGKFVPEGWDFRRSEHNWATGVLHLSLRPYAHTGTTRLVATGAASMGHVAALMLPVLEGDVAALAEFDVVGSGQATNPLDFIAQPTRWLGVAVLPTPSYQVQYLASALDLVGNARPTVIGASGAIASSFLRVTAPASSGTHDRDQVTVVELAGGGTGAPYCGRNRLLGTLRTGGGSAVTISLADAAGRPVATAAAVAATDWTVVDLGVYDVATAFPQDTTVLDVAAQGAGGTTTIDIADVKLVPEETTVVVAVDGAASPVHFDGVAGRVWTSDGGAGGRGVESSQHGGVPKVPVGATVAAVVFTGPNGTPFTLDANRTDVLAAAVKVRERFSFSR